MSKPVGSKKYSKAVPAERLVELLAQTAWIPQENAGPTDYVNVTRREARHCLRGIRLAGRLCGRRTQRRAFPV